ncbi:MAG: hypothetical protein Q4C65_06000 [Eubacteriales bacterium]|nr:hypothetical protein [Eubacteriales bacterium]
MGPAFPCAGSLIAIFVVVFLEYLNLPGFPAGIIMPLAGVWAAHGRIRFLSAMLITIAAGCFLSSYDTSDSKKERSAYAELS